MSLTESLINKARPGERIKKLFDSEDLYLELTLNGGKWWRLSYRFGGRGKRLSLGLYPDVTLTDARELRAEALRLIADRIDPGERISSMFSAARVTQRTADTFETVAREWYIKHAPEWSIRQAEFIKERLDQDILPLIGATPVTELTISQLQTVRDQLEHNGPVGTTQNALTWFGNIIRYAVVTGRTDAGSPESIAEEIVELDDAETVDTPETDNLAVDIDQLAATLYALDHYNGTLPVRCALRLLTLLGVRARELRVAEWADIDLKARQWNRTLPNSGEPHIVPLSHQARATLSELWPLTGRGRYVFPNAKSPNGDKPMNNSTLPAAARRLGLAAEDINDHHLLSLAAKILIDEFNYPLQLVSQQLLPELDNTHAATEPPTAQLTKRRDMMQTWADYLDDLKNHPVDLD